MKIFHDTASLDEYNLSYNDIKKKPGLYAVWPAGRDISWKFLVLYRDADPICVGDDKNWCCKPIGWQTDKFRPVYGSITFSFSSEVK